MYLEVGAFQGEGSFLVVGECQLLLLAETDLQKRQTQAKFSKHDKDIGFVGVERERELCLWRRTATKHVLGLLLQPTHVVGFHCIFVFTSGIVRLPYRWLG